MKASRLLSILMLLQAQGRSSAGSLARALEVSERTILRDIDQLSAAGVPLWGERGRHGGFQLRAGWTTQLTGLTEAEANALLLAGLPGPATELGLGEAAVSTRLKLLASVPASLRDGATAVAERLHIDPIDWYRAPDTPGFLRLAAQGVWRCLRLRVEYSSWRGHSRRELEPLGLVLKAGTWYLVAREAGQAEVRTYRLASVSAMAPGSGSFRRPRAFELARYWQASSARFESGLRPLQAQVLVSPRAMGWLVQTRSCFEALEAVPSEVPSEVSGGAPTDGPTDVAVPEGWQRISMPIESIEHGARQMLGYGAEIEVILPQALRDEVHRQAVQLLARHAPRAAVAALKPAARARRPRRQPG